MDRIIALLLSPDGAKIQQGTAELKVALKDANSVQALCELIVSGENTAVRQYAAVLLRKHLAKLRNWQQVPPEQQLGIKNGLLAAMVQEHEKSVRNAIVQLMGALLRHEPDPNSGWMPEILQLIFNYCSSTNSAESELGANLFATLTDAAPDQFTSHLQFVCEMFSNCLYASETAGNLGSSVTCLILQGMTNLVPFIIGDTVAKQTYEKAIPLILSALQILALDSDRTKFVKAFNILESIADYAPKLLTTNVKAIMDFCFQIANNNSLDPTVRVNVVSYIGCLVRLKKKIIIKQKLVEPILLILFNLMSTQSDDDEEDEEYFTGGDQNNPMTAATQTMDLLALSIPPEKLIPPLLSLLEPALQGQEPLPRRAAFLSIAVIAEGCSEAICHKYLETFLNIIKVGIMDNSPIVRNAAFFALGQFSEHLQPDISKYAPQILPILFDFLHQLCIEVKQGSNEPKHISRMFYALETYCENLDEALVPHLPILMERLFEAMHPTNSPRLRELAFSTISAAANAVKENMLPYFDHLITMLRTYLVKTDNEDIIGLRPQAIDTLAALARTIGQQNFLPLADDSMKYALDLLEETNDPDMRRALYNLVASMAQVVKEDMAAVFPKFIGSMIDSILHSGEIAVSNKDLIEPDDAEISIENTDDEDDDELDEKDIGVENAYLDEKEEAILALKEFAEHTNTAFIPYLELSFENVYKVVDYPQEDIRKVCIDALATFIIAFHKQDKFTETTKYAEILTPKLCELIEKEEEVLVVLAALETLGDMLRDTRNFAVQGDGISDKIFNAIREVLLNKVACQFEEFATGEDDNNESEYDEAVIEAAANVLPLFATALGAEKFLPYFNIIYPTLLTKLDNSKKDDDLSHLRSTFIGVLAESFGILGAYTANYYQTFYQLFMNGLSDQCVQTRQNSVFGLGELVLNSGEKSFDSFPEILQGLSTLVSVETKPPILDNICGAIARLILTNKSRVPLEQVMPVFIQKLPLREDFEEYGSIVKCLSFLYLNELTAVNNYLEQMLVVLVNALHKENIKEPIDLENTVRLITQIRNDFPDKYNFVANSTPELAAFMQAL